MAKNKKQRKVRKTIRLVLLGLLTLGIAGVIYSAVTNRVENEIYPKFQIGALDSETGDYVKDEQKLYTPDLIEYNNLEITLEFNNNVNYQVFFYDEDSEFVNASEVQTKKFKDESEETKYARIVITPIIEDDVETEDVNEVEEFKITLLNKRSFVKQLTIVASVNDVDSNEEVLVKTLTIKGNGPTSSLSISYEDGMTWREWYESEYNDGLIKSEQIAEGINTDYGFYLTYQLEGYATISYMVLLDDVINSDYIYQWNSGAPQIQVKIDGNVNEVDISRYYLGMTFEFLVNKNELENWDGIIILSTNGVNYKLQLNGADVQLTDLVDLDVVYDAVVYQE